MTHRPQAAVLLAIAVLLTGCKPDKAVKTAANIDNPAATSAAPAVDPATAATLHGTVSFSGTAPARIPIDMSMDPACALAPGTNLTEQILVAHGHLANVYVYIKSGAPTSSAPASTAPVVLDQKGCRYLPHVIALQQGGTVEFHNSDPTMHNIHMTPTVGSDPAVDISQGPMGAAQTHTFTAPAAMIPVRCNNHPWMSAFINVAPNPWFAVTSADGTFTLPNLPPGTYTVAAVHEKLGEQDIQVTVPAKSNIQANFTFANK
ncbi:MAG: carboxypeptidase regulatory-like domain-containing protein [Acidobacteriota bacterium]